MTTVLTLLKLCASECRRHFHFCRNVYAEQHKTFLRRCGLPANYREHYRGEVESGWRPTPLGKFGLGVVRV